jgi:hypothetical protein
VGVHPAVHKTLTRQETGQLPVLDRATRPFDLEEHPVTMFRTSGQILFSRSVDRSVYGNRKIHNTVNSELSSLRHQNHFEIFTECGVLGYLPLLVNQF